MKRTLFATLAALVTAGGALTLSPAPAATAVQAAPAACDASDAAIYAAPATVPASPGALLACEPAALTQVPGGIAMKAWKVRYASTDVHGAPVAVSGTVAVPAAPWTGGGARPVIAFNPGTLGLGSQCAFSKQLAGAYQDEYEGDQIAAILKAGYAVAATDGVGYLDGQTHTYVVGVNAGHALLDVARTAFQVPGGGLSGDAKVGLWGYSEGGQASLWAAQLAASYAPGLHVVGDAAGGVPGDLKVTAAGLNGGPFAGFLLDAVVGLHAAYPRMPFEELLNDAGRSAEQQGEHLCMLGTVTAFAAAKIENYTKDGLSLDQIYALSGPDGTWGQIVDAQRLAVGVGPAASAAPYRIGFPVLQYRGIAEEIIPTSTEDATHQAYCSAGVRTQWNLYPGDHLTTDGQAIGDVMGFFADRTAGRAFTGNC